MVMKTMLIWEEGAKGVTLVDYALSIVGTSFLFAIQNGDHPSTKYRGTKILSITVSILTLLLFIYYCNDITAEMTSGPADIPVRNFEDALHHDYRIVAWSSHLIELLA